MGDDDLDLLHVGHCRAVIVERPHIRRRSRASCGSWIPSSTRWPRASTRSRRSSSSSSGCPASPPASSATARSPGRAPWGSPTARRNAEVRPDTLFRIASITKSFTATAVLQLRDEGRLRLDDPLVEHLPEARAIADPHGPIEELTLRRLLTHTSGLQNDVPRGDDPWQVTFYPPDELVARLDRVEVLARPETGWRYSNLAYELLGVVVSRIAGEPFETYLQRAILEPAGLTSTAHFPAGELAERCATGYGPRRHEDDVRASDPYDSGRLLADGGLWSTVEDLARWLTVHSRIADDDRRGDGDRVLDGPTLREMQHPAAFSDWTYAQGLGWATRRIGEDAWVGHTGSLNGFRAIALFRPKDRLGVIALTNGSARPNSRWRSRRWSSRRTGRSPPDRARRAARADARGLARARGHVRGGRLRLRLPDRGPRRRARHHRHRRSVGAGGARRRPRIRSSSGSPRASGSASRSGSCATRPARSPG